MACFGLGTLPLMSGLSLSGQLVPLVWLGRMRRAVPYAALVLAVLFIVRGLGLGILYLSPRLSSAIAPPAAPRTGYDCH
jgi:hypothetical protein